MLCSCAMEVIVQGRGANGAGGPGARVSATAVDEVSGRRKHYSARGTSGTVNSPVVPNGGRRDVVPGEPPGQRAVALVVALLVAGPSAMAQTAQRPVLRAASLNGDLHLDGVLDEPAWAIADSIPNLTAIEPIEGTAPQGRTVVRILAGAHTLVLGIECYDPDPTGITSYSKARDADLNNEDHVKLVFDTFQDGRSGYIFAVNPSGARYDALVANQGEGEAREWDTAWEAATARRPWGWSVEIRIPILSLSFGNGLHQWGFNIQRHLQRLLETSRWASPRRDAKIAHPARAGLLGDLPDFELGIGLTVRPSAAGGLQKPSELAATDGTLDPSLDVTQRIGPNALASLTVNTDFAETEVDTRRTNLTRFSLFFPEKRTFFLEGSDIFAFGLGLTSGQRPDIVPFFSRRIGLFQSREVRILGGGKLNGRAGNTNFGALAVRNDRERFGTGLGLDSVPGATMGAVRFEQNVLRESSVGAIATFGDPEGRPGSWTAGADWTFQTSRFQGNKNFLVGVWGLIARRDGLVGDRTAAGFKLDYPNDTWDVALTYKRIGDGFDPSVGFVSRRGVQLWNAGVNFTYRPGWPWLRQMLHEVQPQLVLDTDGQWESYRVFLAPLNWRFESGERFEFNVVPEGERLDAPLEIADRVFLPPVSYHWVRYRLEADFAAKRRISGRATWWFGPFYDGTLHQIVLTAQIKPSRAATFELSSERNIGRLPAGDFTQQLFGARANAYFSPDLQLSSFLQYDNGSRVLGTNTRLRWTFHPLGDLFVVYNHNLLDRLNRWVLESNELLLKVQYAVRM